MEPALKALIRFVVDNSPAVFALIAVALIAILQMSDLRISDIGKILRRSIYTLSAGARAELR
jgi:hypothetical protein